MRFQGYNIFNELVDLEIVTEWEHPVCPDCKSERVDKRYLDFTPNAKVLNDIYVCMECGCEFILQTPSSKCEKPSRSDTK